MLNYNKIINLNQQFAENHYGIKRFSNGQDFDMVLDDQEAPMRYPVMWMEDLPSPIEIGLEHFAFRVWFLAQVEQLENREDDDILVNANEVKSDMKQLGIDFLSYWKQDSTYKDELRFEITTTWNYAELIQPDELTGGYFDVTFKVKQMFNRCIVPMGTIAPPDPILSDVTGNGTLMVSLDPGEDYIFQIKDESGNVVGTWNATTKIWTVPNGGGSTPVDFTVNDTLVYSQVTTDQTLQVTDSGGVTEVGVLDAGKWKISDVTQTINTVPITPNKAETNKAITIRHANNDPVVVTPITDTETLFVGEIPDVVVLLNYATTFKDGQTTSFVPGDAGDVELGEGVDFFTLSNNNVFGNTNRFTAPDGTQTYGLYICDHACRDQVTGRIRTWHLGLDSATLLNHLAGNAGAGYTNGGLSGWHIPDDLVLGQIYNREQSTAALNYAPFNINANSIANSIALSNTFSAALGLRFANSIIEISVGFGNTMKRITYRDCTEAELATL